MGQKVILPPDQIRADTYRLKTAKVDKFLQPDGSVTTRDGTVILPPHPIRAADYARKSPQVAKWLLSDGSTTDGLSNSDTSCVNLTTDQIIEGVKTFTQSPQVPYPMGGLSAVNKLYVDSKLQTGGTTEGGTTEGIDLIVRDFLQQFQLIYALLGVDVCDGGYFFMGSYMQSLDGGLFKDGSGEDFDCGDFVNSVIDDVNDES